MVLKLESIFLMICFLFGRLGNLFFRVFFIKEVMRREVVLIFSRFLMFMLRQKLEVVIVIWFDLSFDVSVMNVVDREILKLILMGNLQRVFFQCVIFCYFKKMVRKLRLDRIVVMLVMRWYSLVCLMIQLLMRFLVMVFNVMISSWREDVVLVLFIVMWKQSGMDV